MQLSICPSAAKQIALILNINKNMRGKEDIKDRIEVRYVRKRRKRKRESKGGAKEGRTVKEESTYINKRWRCWVSHR